MPIMVPIKQAASITGLSYSCIRNLCLQNKIVFIRSGNKYFINIKKFMEYLNTGEDAI